MLTKNRIIILCLAVAVVLLARFLGPSDIYDKEQPRTTSYTVDMLMNGHGRWIMPHDSTSQPATKPPLYNWLSIPAVAVAGFKEWALRSPSILAAAVTAALIAWFARWLARRAQADRPEETVLTTNERDISLLSAALWLVSFTTLRLLYLARPDMLLVACTTGAWAFGTIALLTEESRGRWKIALIFWLFVGLSALAKGPMAIVPILYIIIGAKLLTGRWSAIQRTQWWWGFPLAMLILCAWMIPAYLLETQHFRTILFGREMGGRIGGPLEVLGRWWRVPHYSIAPIAPWSLFAIAAAFIIPIRRWLRHPLAPAFVWIWLVAAFFSCMLTSRADRFAPMFPATVILASFTIIYLAVRWKPLAATIAPTLLLVAISLAVYRFYFSDEARGRTGEYMHQFAEAVEARTGNDTIAFQRVSLSPLSTLVGRYQEGEPSPTLLQQAQWIIKPYEPGDNATLLSEPLDGLSIQHSPPVRVALIRNTPTTQPRQ